MKRTPEFFNTESKLGILGYALLFILLCATASARHAGATVIEGEVSPGVYKPFAVDASGVSYVRKQGATAYQTWLASAVRTASSNTATFSNTEGWSGVYVFCAITAAPGAETLVFSVQSVNPIDSTATNIAANTAINTTGSIMLLVAPSVTNVTATTTTHTANTILPYNWRLRVTHSGGGNWTYACSYSMIGM